MTHIAMRVPAKYIAPFTTFRQMIRSGSVEKASVQGGGGGGPAGAREGGGVVGGTGGGVGGPAGDSAGTTNSAGVGDEGCEDIGSDGGENVQAESLSIGVGEAGETSKSGAVRA
jgi:hypothetical protein